MSWTDEVFDCITSTQANNYSVIFFLFFTECLENKCNDKMSRIKRCENNCDGVTSLADQGHHYEGYKKPFISLWLWRMVPSMKSVVQRKLEIWPKV